jgi:hypothetical protein
MLVQDSARGSGFAARRIEIFPDDGAIQHVKFLAAKWKKVNGARRKQKTIRLENRTSDSNRFLRGPPPVSMVLPLASQIFIFWKLINIIRGTISICGHMKTRRRVIE